MKIGILTFHRAINYGAVLQCYALYNALVGMGYEVEVIDYRPSSIEKYRMLFRWKDCVGSKCIIEKMRYILSCLSLMWTKTKTNRKFDEFLEENLCFSQQVSSCTNVPQYYDVIFFGSDQIWNPAITEKLDEVYYGQFHKGKTLFVGLAISLGRLELINGDMETKFRQYMNSYDFLSVREMELHDFLFDKYNIESELVCDPSLFFTRDECEKLAIHPAESKYVLLFNLEGNPFFISFAQRIASQLGLNVIMIGANMNPLRRYPIKVRSSLSPKEFLGYIRYADCVVTDSFHATSFSIIMHKNFYTLRKCNNNGRLETILNVTSLKDRFVVAQDDITFAPVNYGGVDNKIDSYRTHTINFINNILAH